MKIRSLFIALTVISLAAPSHGQTYTAEGATLGGVAGAIAGGIIGHQNDETPEGALIGGAVGAITGGLIGNAKDDRLRQQHLYRQGMYQQQQLINQRAARAVSMSDVVSMTRSGLSDGLIINQVRSNGVQRQLQTHDIIALHQQGVSENVIVAMQQSSQGATFVAAPPPVPVPMQREVVVRREYRVVPRYAPVPRVYHMHPPHRYGGRSHRYRHY